MLAAIARQQQSPQSLHDGVESEMVAFGELGQSTGVHFVQLSGQRLRRAAGVRLGGYPVVGQRRPALEARQDPPPVFGRLDLILPAEPLQVVPEGAPVGWFEGGV